MTCAPRCGAPAHAQTTPAPTRDAPVVVAGAPVPLAPARARAGSRAGAFEVREIYTDLVQARFIAGEAALRGVSTTPQDVRRERARHRLRVYLKRTAPRVPRRTSFDADCGPQTFQTPYRSDIVVVFHAIARIAEGVRGAGQLPDDVTR